MKKVWIILIFIISISITACCEVTTLSSVFKSSVDGAVYDGFTKKPVVGATVSIYSGYWNQTGDVVTNTTTDNSGEYHLGSIIPGQYTIKVVASNYVSIWSTFVGETGETNTAQKETKMPPFIMIPTTSEYFSNNTIFCLSWNQIDSTNIDLDLHFTYPDNTTDYGNPYTGTSGNNPKKGDPGRVHVFYGNKDGDLYPAANHYTTLVTNLSNETNLIYNSNIEVPTGCSTVNFDMEAMANNPGDTNYWVSRISKEAYSTNGVNPFYAWMITSDKRGLGPEVLIVDYTNCLSACDGEYVISVGCKNQMETETNYYDGAAMAIANATIRVIDRGSYLAEYKIKNSQAGTIWEAFKIITAAGEPYLPASIIIATETNVNASNESGNISNFAPKRRTQYLYNNGMQYIKLGTQ